MQQYANKSVSELQYENIHELPQKIESLKQQRIDLCVSHYDQFVNTQHTLHQLKNNLQRLQETIQNRTTVNLDALKDQLNHINHDTASVYTQIKSQNAVALQHVGDVVKVIEIPHLVETCVRNGMISEVIDLDDATRHVARHNSDIPVVTDVVRKKTEELICNSLLKRTRSSFDDTQDTIDATYTHLLDKLSSRECRHVPMCLKMVSHLRRLQLCRTERELRILFLQCRSLYIQKQLNQVDREYTQKATYTNRVNKITNVYDYLVSLTDTLKLELFDVCMTYSAVFSTKSETDDHDDILPSFLLHLIHPYLQKLTHYLFIGYDQQLDGTTTKDDKNQLSGEQLAKLLGICMYCGATLARVGADFRAQVSAMFMRRVTLEWSFRLQTAVFSFIKDMKTFDFKAAPITIDRNVTTPNEESSVEITALSPPKVLLNYEPLAELLNNVLTAMNELRQCCPVNVTTRVLQSMQEDLLEPLCTYMQERDISNLNEMEHAVYKSMCKCVAREFISHIVRCLERLFSFHVESILPKEKMNKLLTM
jgi:hypothetical protein